MNGAKDVILGRIHLVKDQGSEALKHLSELGSVAILNLLVEVLDGVRGHALLNLVELLSDGLDFELRIVQLSLPLLELGLECLLSNLEAAHLDIEVLLLLIERGNLSLLNLDGMAD